MGQRKKKFLFKVVERNKTRGTDDMKTKESHMTMERQIGVMHHKPRNTELLANAKS